MMLKNATIGSNVRYGLRWQCDSLVVPSLVSKKSAIAPKTNRVA